MAYFGQLIIDGSTYLVGSTLYGICNTSAGTSAKVVNSGVLGNSFDALIDGITINIQFVKGCTNETITLKVGSTQTLDVVGNCKCNANAILQFTCGQVNGINKWILNAGEKTSTTVMQTYDSTSMEPISGRGVAEAIAPLVPGGDSAANYSVDTEIGEYPSNAKVPTTLAVVNYVNNVFNDKDALVYKGTIGLNGTVNNLPTSGYSAGWIYKVDTTGTYRGNSCSAGDLLLAIKDADENASGADWIIIHTSLSNNTDTAIKSASINYTRPTLTNNTFSGLVDVNTAGTLPTLSTESVTVTGMATEGSVTTAEVTDGTLVITIGTAPTKATAQTFKAVDTFDGGAMPTFTTGSTTVGITGGGATLSVDESITVVVP